MIQNKFGEMIFSEADVVDLVMQGQEFSADRMLVDSSVDISQVAEILNDVPKFLNYESLENLTVESFDSLCQRSWHMPQEYKDLDIAQHILSLCTTEAELQRCGHELMLYQERNLFDLLRYLKYLVDVMSEHQLIWGVGRGSSVASYILYKLGVHRIDSMFYELNVEEFLR